MSPSRSQTRESTPVAQAIAAVKLEAADDTAASTPTSLGKRKASEALEEDDADVAMALTARTTASAPPVDEDEDVKPVIPVEPPAEDSVKRLKTDPDEPEAADDDVDGQPLFAEDDLLDPFGS